MELVYLWVEEYKNIKNQGFNFSPRFECEFDGENLTINENKDYVSIFPDNINITAIVGENGSGKSGILKSIFDFKTNDELKDKRKSHFNTIFKQNLSNSTLEELTCVNIFLVCFDRYKKEYFYYSNNDYLILSINGKDILGENRKKIKDL
jgi:predicted ATPase